MASGSKLTQVPAWVRFLWIVGMACPASGQTVSHYAGSLGASPSND
jgi:hypothetical protein